MLRRWRPYRRQREEQSTIPFLGDPRSRKRGGEGTPGKQKQGVPKRDTSFLVINQRVLQEEVFELGLRGKIVYLNEQTCEGKASQEEGTVRAKI